MHLSSLPTHLAILMDGNRRWAKLHHLPVIAGHQKVVEKCIEELIDHAGHLGIKYLTFWAFSTENWGRPQDEVGGIMNLFRYALEKKAKTLINKGARLNWIGDLSKFSSDIQNGFIHMSKASQSNTGITVTFALNYGGRDEILRAINRHLQTNPTAQITESIFNQLLDTYPLPDPDLIIRTSGEQRLSGFMPWQSTYSELYFTDTLMPDFGTKELDLALTEYAHRSRRLGK